ncbi:hypothetical protein QBC40DRAFT_259011 [Triangularia verruculosa]|uniref:Uncharacterized protein n=1 Tax=Triangularia verruculosa TaxID=2587418 RepID=A0AAN7AQJ0_9PEZI|nr:hypothetical protein QBC40DRAFT_259011 [Triangularia verruculosa]
MYHLHHLLLLITILPTCSAASTSPLPEPVPRPTAPLSAKRDPHICGISLNSTKQQPFNTVQAGFDIPVLSLRDADENQTFGYLQYPIFSQGVALGGTDDDDDDCETHLRAQLRTQLVYDIASTSAPPLMLHSLHLAILPFPWVKIPAGLPDGGLNDTKSIVVTITITSPKSASITFFSGPKPEVTAGSAPSPPQLISNYTINLIPNGMQTWANITLENYESLPDNMYRTPENYTFHDLSPKSTANTTFCSSRAWWIISEASSDRYRRWQDQIGDREYFPRFEPTSFWDMSASTDKESISPIEQERLAERVDRWEMVQEDETMGGRKLCWSVNGEGDGAGDRVRLVSQDAGRS